MAEVEYMENDEDSTIQEDEEESPEESSTSEGSSSEDSDGECQAAEEWTVQDTRQQFPFTENPSMNIGVASSPLDYFKLLFDNTFVNLLVSCINMHAIQITTKQFSLRTGVDFKPTNVEEVYTLLAVFFLMGYIRINHFSFYWSSHPLYNLKFERYMSKDRFCLLMRALAFKSKINYDDNGDSRRSWYDAAKPIADYFNSTMKGLVVPSKELNIDKLTAHWFNELNFVKKRPERIRMHLLSDSSGIFQRVYLCHPDGKNKGEDIVNVLMKDFLDTGRSLYSCPFYTSVALAESLLDKKTHFTGIIKRNKPRNPAFTKKKLKIGCVKTLFNSKGVCVCNVRKTNHTVLALSTEHSGSLVQRGKSVDTEIVSQFKQHTTGMFKRNQMLSDNAPSDLTKKYNRTVLYLLQVMFMNAYLMYDANQAEKLTYSDFRKAILYEILPLPKENEVLDSGEDTDASMDLTDQSIGFGEVIHLPSELPHHRKTKRNCRNCFLERGIRKSTPYYCRQCPQKWGLCLECFREFHNY